VINVYIASKIKHAALFRALRSEWGAVGINILHARWLDQAAFEDDASPEDFHIFWLVDEHDVKDSKVLVVYGEGQDELRGALVEAGIALGAGIPVFVVGDSPSFGSWVNHPHVVKAGTLENAKNMITRLFR
jgi:hypothetical protein